MLTVVCDNRLRLVSGLTKEVADDLMIALMYKNPQFSKLQALGYKHNKEPKFISMWRTEDGVLTLPRGSMHILRKVLSDHHCAYEVEDLRTVGDASVTGSYQDPWGLKAGCEFPVHRPVLWEHQSEIIDAVERYEQCLIRSPTGCIAGDAMIGINRAGKGSQMRLDHVVSMFNGGKSHNRSWDLSIPTMVRARLEDGSIGLIKLSSAYQSGIKPVFRVRTDGGHELLATGDHRFLTVRGWLRLEAIGIGEQVFVENCRRPTQSGREASKPWYKLRSALHHPFAGRKGVKTGGFTVPLHRLVAEAELNGLETEDFIDRCQAGALIGLTFLDPEVYVVHHRDEDPFNNDPANLQVCTHAEHKALHADHARRNIAVRAELATVVSVDPAGDVATYDLTLEAPHNFLANGMVVHNSGKTTAMVGAIAKLGVPALVIMWDSGLLKQWQERIEAELGIPVQEQGLIRGTTCRLKGITLAMQQTLNQWSEEKWENILPVFGLVACDEVQRYAATTFTKQVDRFPAKYRIGVSADERRKDGKEFMIYSMFGPVRHEVDKQSLVDKQLIHEVEVYVVPTSFSAPWYDREEERRKAEEKGKAFKADPQDFTNLITQMQHDQKRNALAVSLVNECVKAGLPTLTFTHRVDHAKMIDRMVSGLGINSGLALGGDDWADLFNQTIAGLRDGSMMVGCGTFGKLGVGHDIPTVAAGIVVTPVHNNRSFFGQVKGRICRTSKGKQNARVIVLWDWKVFGMVPIYNLRKWNSVMRVWCEWDKRWKPVDSFIQEVKRNGRYSSNKESAAQGDELAGLFESAR